MSSIELQSIDPFVIAFRALFKFVFRMSIVNLQINIIRIFRCLNDILSSVNETRYETFSGILLRILTNTRQLCAELIVYDRIEMMLALDQQTLNKQLLPKYLPLIL
ncbi:unnamed protein product [Rotaria sp. Silwood2]|nr:unnamed protein product [Rotaria sp. Silwood2]